MRSLNSCITGTLGGVICIVSLFNLLEHINIADVIILLCGVGIEIISYLTDDYNA